MANKGLDLRVQSSISVKAAKQLSITTEVATIIRTHNLNYLRANRSVQNVQTQSYEIH